MSTFKEIYDILKDLKNEAKRLKSQEMISLAMDVQEKLFELKDEIENVKEENKELKSRIDELNNPVIKEDDICYSPDGYFTLKSEDNLLPYCSACWKTERIQVPLSRQYHDWDYKCSKCQSKIVVLNLGKQQEK